MRGFGVIGIVIAMAFIAVLVLLYMRVMMPSAPDMERGITAIERARDTASAVEQQQRRHEEDLRRHLEE